MLTLSDSAQKAVKGFLEQDTALKGKALRVFVQGGGCSGFQYGFTFSEKQDGDDVTKCSDFDVVIDPMSLPYLNGVQVDWVDSLQGSGFTVKNPNSSGGCGCGKSFSA
ncbi:MAG: iron-sulfur cluster insertion protein ErpA [Planctomycetes bacterium]|nr:iron-sulfur cluster insertion protein ErpA [Planctomycetota bacterium]